MRGLTPAFALRNLDVPQDASSHTSWRANARKESVMTSLASLWLPILVSSVFVFIVSSLIHMATPWHKNEYPKVPDEDRFRNAVGPLGIPPGDYMVPRCSTMKEMKSPEFMEKVKKGPFMVLTVLPNPRK
jgi:hypothetical protein